MEEWWGYYRSPESKGWIWHSKFAWYPRKLDNGRWIFLKKYYLGIRMITGPGDPVFLYQYITPQEHLINILKSSNSGY